MGMDLTKRLPDHARRCYGLPPGAPCPAHDDGTWPEGCDCYGQGGGGMKYSGSLTWAVVIAVMLAIAIALISIGLVVNALGADNLTPCLSKAEARAKYPKQIIYWHTINHCWDNVPVRVAHPRKTDRLPTVDANSNVAPRRATAVASVRPSLPTVFYPSLMSGGGTDDIMLRGEAMQTWPAIADFDTDPPLFLPWLRATALINR